MYFALKHTHMLLAVISIVGFIIRGALRLVDSPTLQRKWVRVVPHIVDTFLLLTAIGLAITIGQYPFVNGWLTAKFLGLLVYIGLGVVTLRVAKTKSTRAIAYILAIAVFFYIGAVAVTKTPLPFLG